ncbi:oligoendopeptidase F [Halobacterium jilantaiense]|uniref:Oligopeptidase F. Metallo peptidase. MEROPS family M03B n=1 Tax=Halobacterium jilantaiense TaxID=355548 RepID=A0A1I0Q6C9_9EURY|nr:oligoendopeptidase F [Halobacterium jilantaiense]SEW22116.1 oligopeptidase F. Metallo peptidase. MEROPS family M03B [Halobacterium jilantaiense]
MSSVPEREELDDEHKWDLESIYATDEEWEEGFEALQTKLEDLEAYEGRLTSDGETLLEALELRDEIFREAEKVSSYARMRSDEDTRDQEYQALRARGQSLMADVSSATSFFDPELQDCTREELQALVEETPGLAEYEHYFDDVLRMKPHTRSAEVEELLSDLGEVFGAPSDAYSMLTDADLEFPTVEDPDGDEVEISQANFTKLLKNPDREFRQTVHEEFFESISGVRNTIGSTMKSQMKRDVKLAQARNYDTAREAALDDGNIPTEVYDTLVETVDDNLDKVQRHADLKREALGVDELEMWDLYMPIVDSESPEIGYEEAREHVVEAVAPLGEDYQQRVAEGLDSNWVDVYENRGKRSGAYSGGTYDTQPFILMNYQDDISSMFTLAHELGHSLHSQYTSEEQPYVYSNYEIFVAEVASTVNEALLVNHLLDTVEDDHFRRHILNEYLERFRSTLYRQTLFADVEQRLHELTREGEALTPDRIDEVYGDRKRAYYANANVDDHIEREWMRIPHFYYNFYVFQYATGISAAVALVEDILDEGQPAADRYLDFLQRGSSEYPLELLRDAGVDMSTSEPIERALGVYDDYLGEAEDLV